MTTAVAIAALALFVIAFRLAWIVPVVSGALVHAQGALAILADRAKSEDEKERAARDAATILFRYFFLITGLTILALIPSSLVGAAAVWARLTSESALLDAFVSPLLIGAAIAFFAADYFVRR